MMGTIIGGTSMAGSLGMATGPLAGELIYDTFASYRWLYVGAWGIGNWRSPDRADVQALPERPARARASASFLIVGGNSALASLRMPRRASRRPTIDARISAGGGYGQSADVMPPTPVVVGALGGVGKTASGKPQQCAPVLVDQVDLDEVRSWRNRFIPLPTEAIGEPMDRHDFAERPARCAGRVAADASDRMRLCGRFGAHPAQDFFGSVRKAKTVAGGDAIWVSRRTTPCSIGVAPAGCARRSICQRPMRIGCGAGETRRGRCQTQFNLSVRLGDAVERLASALKYF